MSRMATVTVASPEIGVLEHVLINPQQQPQTDLTQLQAARTVNPFGPCIQYEDAAEDMENVFRVIIVNANAQREYPLSSGSAIEQEVPQGDIDHIEVSPQGELANGADHHEKIGEPTKLEAEIGYEDEAVNMLGWFQSTFSEIERNGIITLKDFKDKARHSDEFAKHLFSLFDADNNGSISLQELMGGIGRLLCPSRKGKSTLKWFEDMFISILGEDQLLQMDQFAPFVHREDFLERFYEVMISENKDLNLSVMLNGFSKIASSNSDTKWLEWFEQKFSSLGGSNQEIDFDEFKKALHIKESFFAERFFQIFDKDKNNSISLHELREGLSLLTGGSDTDKLQFLFQVYDIDGNGHIDFEELRTVLKSCMGESALQFSDDQLDELTQTLLEDADADNSGSITFEELQSALSRHPGLIENLTFSAANWFQPRTKSRRRRRIKRVPHWMRLHYLRNNLTWIIWLSLYLVVNIILFVEAAVRHRNKGPAVAIARGCGQCLNFNPTFVIILMFRRVLSLVRSTRFSFLFPLDQSIKFHKLVGWTIFFFASIHTIAHIVNFVLISMKPGSIPLWRYFFYVQTGLGWVFGTAGLTGIFLFIFLMIMVICSLPCVRNNGFFEVFYWTHNLFIPWYILLILHGAHFWKWFLVPALVYIIERILRSKWIKLARHGHFYVKSASTLPSKVTYLELTRPKRFNYQPGDYVFLDIPAIAKYEWHPFTISSSPEQDFIGLHIRAVGTWTNKLYEFVAKYNETLKKKAERAEQILKFNLDVEQNEALVFTNVNSTEIDIEQTEWNDCNIPLESKFRNADKSSDHCKRIEVFIDGPYGTPSTHIFQAEHAVLIGAGIGVTPFASILQSIVSKYRSVRQVCPQCNHGWTGDIPSSVMRLRKVDFFWINRDQHSFEWFVSLLTNLEIEESEREQNGFERFLDLHLYMTSALRKTDMKAIGLQMALDLIHKKENRDLITGLKTRTQTGRPDWDKVFRDLEKVKKGKVSVFFCGPPAISKILKTKCAKYKFEYRKEHF